MLDGNYIWKRQWKCLLVLLGLCCSCSTVSAQKERLNQFAIAFYNVENLFDTINESHKEDDDFTPGGAFHYTNEIYRKKLGNIAAVLQGLATTTNGPAMVGLAEVENGKVLKDLCAESAISKKGYKYVWYDGPDIRGIDVALLYDPKRFTVKSSLAMSVPVYNNGTGAYSRDILFVYGTLDGSDLYVLVNHWPSRREGKNETASKRKGVAAFNKRVVDSLIKINPGARIIVMGDLNDNPTDESIREVLGAGNNKLNSRLYNPWIEVYLAGKGTCRYKQDWQLYDQIIISNQLANNNSKWKYDRVEIHSPPVLRDKYTKKGFPYRSFKGPYWINGYSDHFPVIIYFKK